MAASASIDPARFLHEHLAQASPDLLRSLLTTMIDTLMSAEADAVCGAAHGERSEARVNQRNGYRHRDFDTRAGTLDVAIPKLRSGSYFPDWLLERRRRAEAALTSVVATCYLLGVSTRRMEKLVESLGITRLSKSQVSAMAQDLDEQVAAFRTRPLDAGPYTFLAADALVLKVREAGRVVNVHALIAVGVNADGHRELLGLQVSSAEDGAGWLAFFRDLVARGLSGVGLVTSDAHRGLVEAIGATLPGAAWQRCRTHYAANLMAVTPKSSWPWVKTLLHSVYDQPDAESVHAQFDRVLDALETKLPQVAAHLDAARADVLAFTIFPRELWRQVWSNNPQERLNREIRRRTDVVGIFPDRDALIRLVGAVLAEQHDEWTEARRYLGLELLARARACIADPDTAEETSTDIVPALSA
ncbi:IS256 family transposase [Actinomycetospora sp. NBRC 106375]|uniref:IS256 family transposase n=1 Tax=Actinomycetospora sp. NBRC 106375 TaxID=3032207 RepID=UPI0024A2FBCF|nr:IS256 family transposase [Actinomycetospora sp. NBRC 106375]GLZ50218.1 IS256 family transposase [Actinomycetospora sp. NBRC 106375]